MQGDPYSVFGSKDKLNPLMVHIFTGPLLLDI